MKTMNSLLMNRSDLLLPAGAAATSPTEGNTLVNLRSLGIFPGLAGGAGGDGTNTMGDVLTQTVDGVDLNALWAEYVATLEYYNDRRENLISLLTFPVTEPIDRVAVPGGENDFERASEFGEPKGIRTNVPYQSLGYDFHWYDLAVRYSWMFLAEATQSQVDTLNDSALNADIRLQFRKTFEAIFRNATRTGNVQDQTVTVYPFYNGDGWVPPRYKNTVHDGNHSHYLTSAGATIVSEDVDAMISHLQHHGYGDVAGTAQILIFVNSDDTAIKNVVKQFAISSGDSHDFIRPNEFALPRLLSPNDATPTGEPPETINGLTVVGQYGPAIFVEDSWIPTSYLFAMATGGTENPQNPVGIREHRNVSLRGLRLVKGADNDYPLIDSFYQRGFGTGVRHRGNGVVMEVTADASYDIPADYTNVV